MWRLGAFVAGVTALAACGGPPTNPTPPTVLLSSTYSLLCGTSWVPTTPPVLRTVFDFWLASSSATPGSQGVQAITNNGGQINYLFHVPIVRAEIDVDAAKGLWPTVAYAVFSVANLADHTVTIFVDYDHAVTLADQSALVGLGGQGILTFPHALPDGLVVTIADEEIPTILTLPDVTGIENDGLGCLDSARVTAPKGIR